MRDQFGAPRLVRANEGIRARTIKRVRVGNMTFCGDHFFYLRCNELRTERLQFGSLASRVRLVLGKVIVRVGKGIHWRVPGLFC